MAKCARTSRPTSSVLARRAASGLASAVDIALYDTPSAPVCPQRQCERRAAESRNRESTVAPCSASIYNPWVRVVSLPYKADTALVIDTPRLTLRLPGRAAAPRLVSYFETNRRHLTPWEPPFPKGLFTNTFWERRLAQNQQEYREGKSMRLVLFERDRPDGPVIGLANFTQFVRGAFMACTLGYSLDQDAQGQGLMFEGLGAALQHVFEELGMHRVQANYVPTNERSGNLLRRLGFQVEGYARDYIFINGAWRDHILTARVNGPSCTPDYPSEPARR